jgi:hypothetical protein
VITKLFAFSSNGLDVLCKILKHLIFRCQEVLEEVGKYLTTMIQMNTIPIIVHQQNEKEIENYIKKCKDENVSNLIYARTDAKLQKLLNIKTASFKSHMGALWKEISVIIEKKRTLSIPLNVINPFTEFGVFFFEKGIVRREVIYAKLQKRVDFGLFLNDTYSSFNPDILNYFKGLDIHQRKSIEISSKILEKKFENHSEVEKFLSTEMGRYYFKAFAFNEFSIENVLFYEKVLNFKNMKNCKSFEPSQQLMEAKEIIEQFLKQGAIMELNTTKEKMTKVNDYMKIIEEEKKTDYDDLFDGVLIDALGVLGDTYSRFKKSKYFKECEINQKSQDHVVNYLI